MAGHPANRAGTGPCRGKGSAIPPPPEIEEDIGRHLDRLARKERGRLLAALIAHLNDFQLAEDAFQDALERALHHWQKNGLPRSPAAWLFQTARRRAIDTLRRTANFHSKQHQIAYETRLNGLIAQDGAEMAMRESPAIPDERLRLIFTCCHPALDEKSRIALTLHTLGGLTTSEIASAFLDTTPTMAQRLVRAKRKIRQAGIPFAIPGKEQLEERLDTVLSVIYLIFNEGYFSAHGDSPVRTALSAEAMRLARILLALVPDQPEIRGLMALMLLHDSRRAARFDASGAMIALEQQDRSLWHRDSIRQGLEFLDAAMARRAPGPFQIQAAISALHARAPDHARTDWSQIASLYEELARHRPNPVIELNRIVALSYVEGPEAALNHLEDVEGPLSGYQPFHAARADFLSRAGNVTEAEKAYQTAIELAGEETVRTFLQRKLGQMLRASG